MLEKEKRDKLFACVKKDDAAAFGEIASSEIFSAVFGRFPLLSLLYLFDAKRIVKRYFSELAKERPRDKQDSFREADKLFYERAGKCLRYYSSSEISPLEMLAVLGRGKELKRLYAVYSGASRYLPMIHKIYFTRLGEGVAVVGDKLILPKEPLSFKEKKTLAYFASAFLAAFLVVVAVTVFSFCYFGTGSESNFYHARTAGGALSALEHGYCVSLEKDVILSGTAEEYAATFDGGDHLVRLTAPFAAKVTGEIRDVIFVLEEGFTGDAVILENGGTLKNVRVVAEDITLAKGGENMGLLTAVNKGVIESCSAVMSVVIEGEGGGDCFFAPFAGNNEGAIHNCLTDGSITAKNVDIAGIAGKNGENGAITDCAVKGVFSEVSDIKQWTPNVAGVAAQNDGAIYGCTVEGSMTSDLRSPALEEGDSPASAYAAGIACVNGGSVKQCENNGEVSSIAQNGYAFAGGVAAINAHYLSSTSMLSGTVESSQGKGKVQALSSTHDAYAGGIVAQNPQGASVSACTQSETVKAESAVTSELQTTAAAYAGGVVALNLDAVTDCRFTAAVNAKGNYAHAFAGGIVALNSYVLYQNLYYLGTVQTCLSSGAVKSESALRNAYAGGVAGENNQGTVTSCGQTSSVEAVSADETVYDFTGGIVGYNAGTITKCFFTGTTSSYSEVSFVGGICGLIRLPYTLRINMAENAFAEGWRTSGSVLSESGYYDLRAGYVYGLAFFESDPSYARYATEILDLGGVNASVEEIQNTEGFYYE